MSSMEIQQQKQTNSSIFIVNNTNFRVLLTCKADSTKYKI